MPDYLKLAQMRKIAKDEMLVQKFRQSLIENFGPAVGKGDLNSIAENACDELYCNSHKNNKLQFDTKLVESILSIRTVSDSVKKLCISLLPESRLEKFTVLPDATIRQEIAKRLPLEEAKKLLKRSPNDHFLKMIVEDKAKEEKRLVNVALGNAVKSPRFDLSDEWYEKIAKQIYEKYSAIRDEGWEENAVQQVAMHYSSTTDQRIDSNKLLDCVMKLKEIRDDYYVNENYSLASLSAMLRESAELEMEEFDESDDDFTKLSESKFFNQDFSRQFQIEFENLPSKFKSYLSEGIEIPLIPKRGIIPEQFVNNLDVINLIERFSKSFEKKNRINLRWQIVEDDQIVFKCTGVK